MSATGGANLFSKPTRVCRPPSALESFQHDIPQQKDKAATKKRKINEVVNKSQKKGGGKKRKTTGKTPKSSPATTKSPVLPEYRRFNSNDVQQMWNASGQRNSDTPDGNINAVESSLEVQVHISSTFFLC